MKSKDMTDLLVGIIMVVIIIGVMVALYSAIVAPTMATMNNGNITSLYYLTDSAVSAPTGGDYQLNTTKGANPEQFLTVDISAPTLNKNSSLGKQWDIKLSDISSAIDGIPNSTWTITYRAYANVTDICKLWSNISIVDSGGIKVWNINDAPTSFSALVTASNSSVYQTISVLNFTTAFDSSDYLQIEPMICSTTAQSVEINLLEVGTSTISPTTVNLTYSTTPSGLEVVAADLLGIFYWIAVIFVTIALLILVSKHLQS